MMRPVAISITCAALSERGLIELIAHGTRHVADRHTGLDVRQGKSPSLIALTYGSKRD